MSNKLRQKLVGQGEAALGFYSCHLCNAHMAPHRHDFAVTGSRWLGATPRPCLGQVTALLEQIAASSRRVRM
jgi:hypothetical protein